VGKKALIVNLTGPGFVQKRKERKYKRCERRSGNRDLIKNIKEQKKKSGIAKKNEVW